MQTARECKCFSYLWARAFKGTAVLPLPQYVFPRAESNFGVTWALEDPHLLAQVEVCLDCYVNASALEAPHTWQRMSQALRPITRQGVQADPAKYSHTMKPPAYEGGVFLTSIYQVCPARKKKWVK